jgi:perosamine synthetase
MTGRPLLPETMCVQSSATVSEAILRIDANLMGVVFVVEAGRRLVGSVSDGDIRRSLLRNDFSMEWPVTRVMNAHPSFLRVGTGAEEAFQALSQGISSGKSVFPRVDAQGEIKSFSHRADWGLIPIAEPQLSGNEASYVLECIESNWISSTGPFVERFERAFADFTGLASPVAVSNGTVALTLALQSLGLPAKAEVIVPDFTFAASANAVIAAGGVPVLADVEASTWGVSRATVEHLISERTWGIMAVHMYGNPCDTEDLSELCKERGLRLIEDCAEAIGSTIGSSHVGGYGDAAAFSFFGNKTLTTGEGGMVFFRNPDDANFARVLRDHGMSKSQRYWHDVVGFNYRLTNLQAAVGVAQCERAALLVESKLVNAATYIRCLESVDLVSPMPTSRFGDSSYWLMPVMIAAHADITRDSLMEHLASQGIQTRITFPPLHAMPAFSEYRGAGDFPNSIDIASRGVCLPNNPGMNEQDVERVVESLAEAMRSS